MSVFFDFSGLIVRVVRPDSSLADEVRRDFTYFEQPPQAEHQTIEMHLAPAPYERLPTLSASLTSLRNVTFRNGSHKCLGHFGRGLEVPREPLRTIARMEVAPQADRFGRDLGARTRRTRSWSPRK